MDNRRKMVVAISFLDFEICCNLLFQKHFCYLKKKKKLWLLYK